MASKKLSTGITREKHQERVAGMKAKQAVQAAERKVKALRTVDKEEQEASLHEITSRSRLKGDPWPGMHPRDKQADIKKHYQKKRQTLREK